MTGEGGGCRLRTTEPTYISDYAPELTLEDFAGLPWVDRVSARSEAFLSADPLVYGYGSGRGYRTYTSSPWPRWIGELAARVRPDDPG